MITEFLIKKKETYYFPRVAYVRSVYYRYTTGCPRVFDSKYQYWYDGRLFLIGNDGKDFGMTEAENGAWAVTPTETCKISKSDADAVIEILKRKIRTSGRSIHEVIEYFKNCNVDLETWLANLLIT